MGIGVGGHHKPQQSQGQAGEQGRASRGSDHLGRNERTCSVGVLPCCWLGAVFSESSTAERRQFADLLKAYGGIAAVDARKNGLRAVVEGALFQQAIQASWEQSSIASGKLAICARTCGREDDPLDQGIDQAARHLPGDDQQAHQQALEVQVGIARRGQGSAQQAQPGQQHRGHLVIPNR